jgi:hypothetical protein
MSKQGAEDWAKAKGRFHLSERHIIMAKQLGMNPRKFGKMAPNRSEPWKAPISEFIERLYFKRFGRKTPEQPE